MKKILSIALVFILIQITLSNALTINPVVNSNSISGYKPSGIINEPKSNRAPLASFNYMPYQPRTTNNINFWDSSYDTDGVITSWYWTFGDGGTSTAQNPTHTYTTPGTYTTSLTVTDNSGASSTYTLKYNIQDIYTPNVEPAASAMCKRQDGVEYVCLDTLNPPIRTNEPIQFIDYSKNDYDTDPIVSWYWNFGDGTISTQKNPIHSYSLPGHYHIALIATDSRGGSGAWFAALTITTRPENNHPPVANADPDLTETDVGVEVGFVGYYSYDPDGDLLTYSWNFGDGGSGTGSIVKHTYTAAGTYSVILTVSDGLATDTDTVTAIIGGPKPKNELSVSEVKLDKNYLTEEDRITYSATIANLGDSDANNVRVLNFLQSYGVENTVLYKYDYISIPAKSTKTIRTDFGYVTKSLAKISVFVDDDNQIEETNENNNIMNNSFAIHGKIDYIHKKVLDHWQFESSYNNGAYEKKEFTVSGNPQYLEIDFFSSELDELCSVRQDWLSTFDLIDPTGFIYKPSKISDHQEIQIENPVDGLWKLVPKKISGKNSPMVTATIRTYIDSKSIDASIPFDDKIFKTDGFACSDDVWSGEARFWLPDNIEIEKDGQAVPIDVELESYKNANAYRISIITYSKSELWIEGQTGPYVDLPPVVYVDKNPKPADYGFVLSSMFSGIISLVLGEIPAGMYTLADIVIKVTTPPNEGTSHEKNYAYVNSENLGSNHTIRFSIKSGSSTGVYHAAIMIKLEPGSMLNGQLYVFEPYKKFMVGFEYPITITDTYSDSNITSDMLYHNISKILPVSTPSAK